MGLMDRLRARKAETVDVELAPWRLVPGGRVQVVDVDEGVLADWRAQSVALDHGHIGDVQLALVGGVPTVFHDSRRLGVMRDDVAGYYVAPLRTLMGSGYFGVVEMFAGDSSVSLRIANGTEPHLIPANDAPAGMRYLGGKGQSVTVADPALLVPYAGRSAWFIVRLDGDDVAVLLPTGQRVGTMDDSGFTRTVLREERADGQSYMIGLVGKGSRPTLALG